MAAAPSRRRVTPPSTVAAAGGVAATAVAAATAETTDGGGRGRRTTAPPVVPRPSTAAAAAGVPPVSPSLPLTRPRGVDGRVRRRHPPAPRGSGAAAERRRGRGTYRAHCLQHVHSTDYVSVWYAKIRCCASSARDQRVRSLYDTGDETAGVHTGNEACSPPVPYSSCGPMMRPCLSAGALPPPHRAASTRPPPTAVASTTTVRPGRNRHATAAARVPRGGVGLVEAGEIIPLRLSPGPPRPPPRPSRPTDAAADHHAAACTIRGGWRREGGRGGLREDTRAARRHRQ